MLDAALTDKTSLEKEIYELCGFEFNIASPKQLGEVLFEKLAIAKGKKNKTGYVTNAETLEKLALIHPVPLKVLEYRKYSKLYSTYDVGLLDVMFDDEGNIIKKVLLLLSLKKFVILMNLQKQLKRDVEWNVELFLLDTFKEVVLHQHLTETLQPNMVFVLLMNL